MKAPDKIYIPIIEEDGKKLLCTNWWETDARSRYVNETIPYIRKDALMEWLEERISDGDDEGLMTNQIANLAYKDVIDKLNSM